MAQKGPIKRELLPSLQRSRPQRRRVCRHYASHVQAPFRMRNRYHVARVHRLYRAKYKCHQWWPGMRPNQPSTYSPCLSELKSSVITFTRWRQRIGNPWRLHTRRFGSCGRRHFLWSQSPLGYYYLLLKGNVSHQSPTQRNP